MKLLCPERASRITVESFFRLELIAARGRQTISLASNFGGSVDPDLAEITAAYAWATAMSMPGYDTAPSPPLPRSGLTDGAAKDRE